jgi:threonylcarbamoyladenosine tRNA methylthiotransferase CDKAL1
MTDEFRDGPPVAGEMAAPAPAAAPAARRALRVLPASQPATPAGEPLAALGRLAPGAPKAVKIVSLGCVENALTSARYQKLLALEEWRQVEAAEEADLVLVNTCGVSQERAQDSLHAIESLRRTLRKDARLVVTGCLVNIDPATLEGTVLAGAELASPRDPSQLEALVGATHRLEDVRATEVPTHFLRPRLRALNWVSRVVSALDRAGLPHPARVPRVLSAFEQPGWHFVQVSKGCVHACSYCAIRFAKGWIKSEDRRTIVDEVARGVAAGHRYVVLVADDTGSYGLDKDTDIGELLEELVALPGEFGIHVRNLEPMGMLRAIEGLKRAVASGKIRAITVPMQSGSDRVLEDMGRGYTREAVMEALGELRRLAPEMLIVTHVLVGFPGETHRDFKATLGMIRAFEFDGVAPDCFSTRRNTRAVHLSAHVPWMIRRLRYFAAIGYIVWRVYLRAGLSLRWRPARGGTA